MTFIEKVRGCEPITGTHVNFTDPCISELYGALGFDFVWIDMEHTEFTPEQVHNHIMAARSQGTASLVRVPVHDLTNTKRVLEMGPEAIIFPMVKNAKEAKELISWTLYPPYGTRGCGPKGAVRYGFDDEHYFHIKGHIEKLARFVMIESESAVNEIEQIVSIPYLDGVIIGMFDLSGSINQLGNIYCDKNVEMAKKVIETCKKYHKSVGVSLTANDEKTLQFFTDLGCNIISTGAEFVWMLEGAKKALATLKKIQKK